LGALLVAIYAVQAFSGAGAGIETGLGMVPATVLQGRWWTPATHLFVHGFWGHAILNAVGVLAFGAPVARFLGERGRGPLRFFGFFLLCGVVAGLGYLLLHPTSTQLLVGASGGAAGLMGAASRMFTHPGRLSGLTDRTVVGLGVGWVVINLMFAVIGVVPGIGAEVAWEAHLIGYAAGLFGVAPFARMTRAR